MLRDANGSEDVVCNHDAQAVIEPNALRGSWVMSYLRRYRKVLVFAIVASLVAYLFAAGLMFTSGYMITLAATLPLTVLALHLPSIFVRIFGIGKPVIQYFQRLASHDWVLRMTSDVRRRIFIASERCASAVRSTLGGMLGLFTEDIEHIQNLYLRSVFPMIELMILYVLIVIGLALFSPAVALAAFLVIGVCLIVLPMWSVAANGARLERQRDLERNTYESLAADMISASDWRLSGRRDEFVDRNLRLFEQAYEEQRDVDEHADKASVLRAVLFGLLIAGIACWAIVAFSQACMCVDGASGTMSSSGWFATGLVDALGSVAPLNASPWALNWVAAFVLCMFPLLGAFDVADEAALDYEKNRVRISGLDFIEVDPEHDDAIIDAAADRTAHDAGVDGTTKESPAYRVCLHPGEHVAVVGRSGSGKTTLLESIFSGKLLDWCEVGFAGMSEPKIGIVEQDPHVFLTTVRENLLVAKPDATDDELLDVLDRVNLTAYVERLPRSLDTIIAEGGSSMSGGERHRLALARVLLYDCDVVLLDEPYKHLDAETARDVADSLFELLGEKSVVMATHLMLDEGEFDRIIELGDMRVVADSKLE